MKRVAYRFVVVACAAFTMSFWIADAQAVEKKGALPFQAAEKRISRKPPSSSNQRIYYGDKAPAGAYPFMVALIHGNSGNKEQDLYEAQFCGGSLIKGKWILTAAHCLMEEDDNGRQQPLSPAKVNVYVGSNVFKNGLRLKVSKVVVHPSYNPATLDNDIAVLELASPPVKVKTETIRVLQAGEEGDIAAIGKPVFAAGWGEIETGDYPRELRHVQLQIVDAEACNKNVITHRLRSVREDIAAVTSSLFLNEQAIGEIAAIIEKNAGRAVTERMICSGVPAKKQDSCQGDSGGPLFARTNNGFVLVGLTSWGIECGLGDQGLYGIYTRVTRFNDWIEQSTK